ncbi:MAG TPA: hypothetical protein VGY13_11030 [Solirubrobacteraceae bacterium]|nr:hypothetical protein [Solirubrobacteraceae bacterium]
MAATETYLEAKYALARAELENAPASQAAVRGFVQVLGRECAGVLDGLPPEAGLGSEGRPPTPREEGEAKRRDGESSAIELWEQTALLESIYAPDATAARAFIQAVKPLRWSDPGIARNVESEIGALEAALTAPSASTVCAALQSWRRSDYRVLPPVLSESETYLGAQVVYLLDAEFPAFTRQLAQYEQARAKALQRQTTALLRRFLSKLKTLGPSIQALSRTLGSQEEEAQEEGIGGSTKDTTLIGQGRTLVGGTYTFRVKNRSPESHCPLEVELARSTPPSGKHKLVSVSGTNECLSGRERRTHATVTCQRGEGAIEVQAWLPGDTRSVRLTLSSGRTVSSRAVVIPKRLGGPLALYDQALRGPSPYPVSLAALGAHGRTLRTLALRPVRDCKPEPTGLHRVRRPIFTTLAHGTTTTGVPFTMTGTLVTFGRDHHSFNVQLQVEEPGVTGALSSSSRIELVAGNSPEALAHIRDARIFSPQLADECPPHEYAIVYGLLAKPGETVLARTPAGLEPLTEVAIPKRLKVDGVAVYGSFAAIPSEVVVQGAGGRTLFSESLAEKAKEHAEFCEGYAEG